MSTLPLNIHLKQSELPGRGYEVWSSEEIPIGVRFGPYQEEFIDIDKKDNFQWQAEGVDKEIVNLDERNESESNWLEYVNHACHKEEQNMISISTELGVYFITCTSIPANTELLVHDKDNIVPDRKDDQQPSTSRTVLRFSQDIFANEELEEEINEADDEFTLALESSDSDWESILTETPVAAPKQPKRQRQLSSIFEWKNDAFVPVIHNFDESSSGIVQENFQPSAETTEAGFFRQLVSEDLVSTIVQETNRYASQFLEANATLPSRSVMNTWTEVTVSEIYLFLAITMLMVRNKKLKISEYWSTDWLIRSEAFPKLMARDRYLVILRMLHFSNNKNQPTGNRLFKISSILDMFHRKFKETFIPFEKLCIDESLILFKGRLAFKQYIKTKRHRFGIKLFVMCDVKTGYILDLIVYTGKDTDITTHSDLGISGSIVMNLLDPYLDKGHTLFTDNWYTSPLLSNELHKRRTNTCGTVNPKRKHMPKFEGGKLEKGARQSMCAENMMVLRWQDKREVTMLSTINTDTMKETGKLNYLTNEAIIKPECVIAYNASMGTVDLSDLLLSSIECVRKTTKWYKKVFFHLIDIALINSHSLHNLHFGIKTPVASFQLNVIRQLIEEFQSPQIRRSVGRPSTTTADTPLRLVGRHFPVFIPATTNMPNPKRNCRVCAHTLISEKKRRQTRYMCAECDAALCVIPCFQAYHTLKKF